jgi:hypothetical protein
MKDINSDKAKERYGISMCHQRMDNGELRFRLIKDDGTAYVRTEAGSSGSWQESHCHKNVKETCVVQKGWIACAKMCNERCTIQVFREDEIFTIEPSTAHNIYMAKGSVIHTVKHGASKKENRILNGETEKLDKIVQNLSEGQTLALAENDENKNNAKKIYSREYCHFDKLIWQDPTWCTAIFTATIAGGFAFISLDDKSKNTIVNFLNLSSNNILFYYFSFFSIVLMVFSYVLYRLRIHQRPLGRWKNIPFYKSAQLGLQLVTCFEFCILLLFVFLIKGVSLLISGIICTFILLVCMLLAEYNLRKKSNNIGID